MHLKSNLSETAKIKIRMNLFCTQKKKKNRHSHAYINTCIHTYRYTLVQTSSGIEQQFYMLACGRTLDRQELCNRVISKVLSI